MDTSRPFQDFQDDADEQGRGSGDHIGMAEFFSYRPPKVPLGDMRLRRWVHESTLALPQKARYFWSLACCFANDNLVLQVSEGYLAEVCAVNSRKSIAKYIEMGERIGVVRKISDRTAGEHPRPARYLFLAGERDYVSLPARNPHVPHYLADSYTMRRIEQQEDEINMLREMLARAGEEAIAQKNLRNGQADNDYSKLSMETLQEDATAMDLPMGTVERLRLEVIDNLKALPEMTSWKKWSFAADDYLKNPGKFRTDRAAAQAARDAMAAKGQDAPERHPRCRECGEAYFAPTGDTGLCGHERCNRAN